MPELPDLVYVRRQIADELIGQVAAELQVKKPLVLRNSLGIPAEKAFAGASLDDVFQCGPFLGFTFSNSRELIMNMMLVGKFRLQPSQEKKIGRGLIFILLFQSGQSLHYLDEKQMGKAYLVSNNGRAQIPRFSEQGVDLLSDAFTAPHFHKLARKSRKQVRTFLMDQSLLSSIGNAYADEILFEAALHPKTLCSQLDDAAIEGLYQAIGKIMQWGIDEVAAAGQTIDVKVRAHMRVRNKKGEPCPRCGSTIRTAGVLGHDAFFCPQCQPATRPQFVDWQSADASSKKRSKKP